MTDRGTIFHVIESLFEDWIENNKNIHPLAVENMKQLEADALAMLKEHEAVEQKTGHWIYLQYCANEGVYCSECHTKMFDRYPMKKKLSQFCGRCGAKMEEQVMLE